MIRHYCAEPPRRRVVAPRLEKIVEESKTTPPRHPEKTSKKRSLPYGCGLLKIGNVLRICLASSFGGEESGEGEEGEGVWGWGLVEAIGVDGLRGVARL